jgi:hypothetical protein
MDVGHRTGDRKYQFLSEIRFTISKNAGERGEKTGKLWMMVAGNWTGNGTSTSSTAVDDGIRLPKSNSDVEISGLMGLEGFSWAFLLSSA